MATARRLALILAAALAGCASTAIVSSWKDPAATSVRFQRVVVMAPARDPGLRRSAEDELAQRIPNAIPSYTLFSDGNLQDRAYVRQQLRARGFDGLVVFGIVSVNRETVWTPGAYWGPAYAYGGWPMYDPGYVSTETSVRVDTDVFDLRSDRLVWAAASRSYNPRSVRNLVDDVTRAVGNELRREGLL